MARFPGIGRMWDAPASRVGFIVLIYTIAHGLALLDRGLFWDDWVFWRQDAAVVEDAARSMGSTWPAAVNRLFYYNDGGITLGRTVTFVAMLVTALLLYDVLRRLPRMDESTAMWSAAVFSVFPAFESRIALVMTGYALSLALFAGAVWLLVRFGPTPPAPVRVVSALLFLGSFQTGSLLVFFAVVPVVLLLAHPPEQRTVIAVGRRLASQAELLALPFGYWIAKSLWFRPSGLYVGYNTIVASPASFAATLWSGLRAVTVGPLTATLNVLPLKLPLAAGLLVAALAVLTLRRASPVTREGWWRLLLAGTALLVLAVAPYAAVGKVPGSGWETRHQLLVPFGAALVAVALAKALSWRRFGRALPAVVLSAMLLGSVAFHVASYVRYERDWLKQQALMVAFTRTPDVRASRFLLVEDGTANLDVTQRMFYEYSGMLAETTGEQCRFVADRTSYSDDHDKVTRYLSHKRYYKLGDFAGGSPDCIVSIGPGELDLRSTFTVLRLTLLDWTDRNALRDELSSALTIRTRGYTEADTIADRARKSP